MTREPATRGECITGIFEALDRVNAYLDNPTDREYWQTRDELGDIENALSVAQDELRDAYERMGLNTLSPRDHRPKPPTQ